MVLAKGKKTPILMDREQRQKLSAIIIATAGNSDAHVLLYKHRQRRRYINQLHIPRPEKRHIPIDKMCLPGNRTQ